MTCQGPSRTISIAGGPEDFEVQEDGPYGPRLLLAALSRPLGHEPGTLWSVNLTGKGQWAPAQIRIPRPVYPAGIALAKVDGETRLYFTNQPPRGYATVEAFRLDGDVLTWIESLFDSKLVKTPNDLVVLSNGDIYLTDLGLPRNVVLQTASIVFSIAAGTVLHFDANVKRWSTFAEGLEMANGIAVDPGGRALFVNEFGARRVQVIDLSNREIKASVRLDGYPDNLRWEIAGQVLNVAMHASKIRVGLHLKRRATKSPSLGCRLHVGAFLDNPQNEIMVEHLYDLPDFSGGSTALVRDGTLYVSQVVGEDLLIVENC